MIPSKMLLQKKEVLLNRGVVTPITVQVVTATITVVTHTTHTIIIPTNPTTKTHVLASVASFAV